MDDGASSTVDESDRIAAERALARNWPVMGVTDPKYASMLEALACLHRRMGADRFELRYNLRPPKGRAEQWLRQLMHRQIRDQEFLKRAKADAERPIDLEMLKTFHDAYQDQLSHYSMIMQRAVLTPEQLHDRHRRHAAEEAIDAHVESLKAELPLWRENLRTAFEFLEEMRVTAGRGLAKLGEFEGISAHWLAQLIFTWVIEVWQSCKEIADRSQTDPRYLYSSDAIKLFQRSLQKLPLPQHLNERLREEFILGRIALKQGSADPTGIRDGHGVSNRDPGPKDLDNESRELILIGDMFSLVGAAGHIFRPTANSDWGIDGEIEFKDAAGHASGRRVHVQLKSGDSHLRKRSDGVEVFDVKNPRHLEYWAAHLDPVMLVVRDSNGLIRWMDVRGYLHANGRSRRQIIFTGETLTAAAVQALASKIIGSGRP